MDLGTKSPLDSLYSLSSGQGKYDFSYAKFPEIIDDITGNGHYMNFYINVHERSSYINGQKSNWNINNTYSLPDGAGFFGIKSTLTGKIPTKFEPVKGLSGNFGSTGPVRPLYKRINKAVSLYVPPSGLSFGTNLNWGEIDRTSAFGLPGVALQTGAQVGKYAGSLADKFRREGKMDTSLNTVSSDNYGWAVSLAAEAARRGAELANKAGAQLGDLGTIVKGAAGVATNPNILVMFQGLSRRNFQFQFVFIPSNEKESRNIRNIIKTFRFHSSPELLYGTSRFYLAPSTFDIEVFHKGKTNKNIPKFKTCALTNCEVNYSPRGWSTYVDGMPAVVEMTLTFSEIEQVTRQDVEEGF
jgi:hypothetical protein